MKAVLLWVADRNATLQSLKEDANRMHKYGWSKDYHIMVTKDSEARVGYFRIFRVQEANNYNLSQLQQKLFEKL